jgi:hypothetical protein
MTTNPPRSQLQSLRVILGLSLLLAGAGVLTQYLVGVPGFPKIPPGPIILGIAGIMVLTMAKYRWTLILGLVAALFVLAGGLIEGSVWGRLADPGQFDVWIGVFMQWVGLVIGAIAGALAVRQAYARTRTPALR